MGLGPPSLPSLTTTHHQYAPQKLLLGVVKVCAWSSILSPTASRCHGIEATCCYTSGKGSLRRSVSRPGRFSLSNSTLSPRSLPRIPTIEGRRTPQRMDCHIAGTRGVRREGLRPPYCGMLRRGRGNSMWWRNSSYHHRWESPLPSHTNIWQLRLTPFLPFPGSDPYWCACDYGLLVCARALQTRSKPTSGAILASSGGGEAVGPLKRFR